MEQFEELVADVGFSPVPEKFRDKIRNVALIAEDVPSRELCDEIGLGDDETLLGFYYGIPHTERDTFYGVIFGGNIALPDKIYLFRDPILEEAEMTGKSVRRVIEETVWHEVGHHFGLSEEQVERRENELGWHDGEGGSERVL